MATGLEKSDDALRAALIVAGQHIRRQKYNEQSREFFRHLRTVLASRGLRPSNPLSPPATWQHLAAAEYVAFTLPE